MVRPRTVFELVKRINDRLGIECCAQVGGGRSGRPVIIDHAERSAASRGLRLRRVSVGGAAHHRLRQCATPRKAQPLSHQRARLPATEAQTMAGGFVGPGDRVDVIVTYKVKVQDKDNPAVQAMVSKFATETILENVRVLAADQKAKREEDQAKVARTVTLEVDGAGAEKLALAAEMGDLVLSLRGIGDNGSSRNEQMTTDVSMSRVLKGLAEAQDSGGGASGMVRIYNGGTATNMAVRRTSP